MPTAFQLPFNSLSLSPSLFRRSFPALEVLLSSYKPLFFLLYGFLSSTYSLYFTFYFLFPLSNFPSNRHFRLILAHLFFFVLFIYRLNKYVFLFLLPTLTLWFASFLLFGFFRSFSALFHPCFVTESSLTLLLSLSSSLSNLWSSSGAPSLLEWKD